MNPFCALTASSVLALACGPHCSEEARTRARAARACHPRRSSARHAAVWFASMAPTNAQKKALAKAKRGIVSSGAMSSKSGFDESQLKPKELPCPHCERTFKQIDRLRMHVQKQHADVASSSEGDASAAVVETTKKVSAKAALIIAERERAKEAAAKERASNSEAKHDPTPFVRMSCKLPSVILREFVQKQKEWKTPMFRAREETAENGGGWTCKVVLQDKHKPDKDAVFFWKERCETKAEAEHRAAVVALAKIANSLPLQRLLPAEYKETFIKCELLEKKRQENAKERAQKEEERISRMKQAAKRESAQVLTMSEEKRLLVETILKEHYVMVSSDEEDDVELTQQEGINELCDKLESLGFARDDALAASKATKSKQASSLDSAITWLCVHVPESRLPVLYAPKSLNEGGLVVLRKAQVSEPENIDERPENLDAAFLWDRGYSQHSVEESLKTCATREAAHEYLFRKLLSEIESERSSWLCGDSNASKEDWEDELIAIEAIYGDDNVTTIDGGIQVCIDTNAGIRGFLEVRRPSGCRYPGFDPPLIACHANGESRSEFMQATRELARIAIQSCGAPCVHTLIDSASSLIDARSSTIRTKIAGTGDVPTAAIATTSKSHIPTPKVTSKTIALDGTEMKTVQPSAKRLRERRGLSDAEMVAETERLRIAFNEYLDMAKSGKGEAYAMMKVRANLPASGSREEVTRAVNKASVVILSGETGCGKSTQVPQFVLEAEIAAGRGGQTNIIVTQPRRISAIGLAERVAAERCEKCGDVVGYSVRLESKQSARTRLLFCTTGILLRRLLSDPLLENTTHVILDEVHERSLDSDLLLLLLRRVISKNPKIRIVLMSATADADLFDHYFKHPSPIAAVNGVTTMQVHIAGFTHPVREYFLEDVFELTGHTVGRGGPYAKRKQVKRVKSNEQVEALLAEKATKRKAERAALGLENDDGEEEEEEDDAHDVPDDWDLVDDEHAYEVKQAHDVEESTADANPVKTATQLEDERRKADLLAEASRSLSRYSQPTQRSIQNVDESILNYDAIEQLVATIIRTELEEGPSAFVPPPIAGTKPKEFGLGAILIFMPGQFEIMRLIRKLEHSRLLESSDVGELRILPLYGSLSSKEQRRISRGHRKVYAKS